jgi:hypothetical protein
VVSIFCSIVRVSLEMPAALGLRFIKLFASAAVPWWIMKCACASAARCLSVNSCCFCFCTWGFGCAVLGLLDLSFGLKKASCLSRLR